MSKRLWGAWSMCGTMCMLLATLTMLSPHAASVAITPWVIFLIANIIWTVDNIRSKMWTWTTLGVFFIGWDCLLIYSRLYDPKVFSILEPIITIMERLP